MRRMVDEFSSFARMPKPTFGVEDVRDILKQAVFLFEVAKPDIRFHVRTPDAIEPLVCDRRLLSQALPNIIKHDVEAIEEKSKKSDHDDSRAHDAQLDEGPGAVPRIITTNGGTGAPQ